jgi:L-histidine N-alpha-methyltransferase
LHAAVGTCTYIPIDVSADFLDESAARLRGEFRGLHVAPAIGVLHDRRNRFPYDRETDALFAFLGSTIGNFAPLTMPCSCCAGSRRDAPRRSLVVRRGLADERCPSHRSGVQRRRRSHRRVSIAICSRVLNRELGADFAVDAFQHLAFYSIEHQRIEMHLVASGDQEISIPQLGTAVVRDHESIRTEICCKYDRRTLEELLEQAGLSLDRTVRVDSPTSMRCCSCSRQATIR